MHNITLISSFHIESGKCNSNELYNIIRQIQPEVIFEELPEDVFKIIYSPGYKPESIEAIAIKEYLKDHHIKHIPVDTYEINESELFQEYDTIWNNNIEYGELFNRNLSLIAEQGYSFLK